MRKLKRDRPRVVAYEVKELDSGGFYLKAWPDPSSREYFYMALADAIHEYVDQRDWIVLAMAVINALCIIGIYLYYEFVYIPGW